ncbi:MAG: DUF1631 family protein [Betaproteobacteria bacterium]
MSSPAASTPPPSFNDSGTTVVLSPAEAQALLRTGFERFEKKLMELTGAALELTDDLFESTSHIPDGEVETFRQQRGEWLKRFRSSLSQLFERRLTGNRRKGLRPDADASTAALRVLTPFDHEKQSALTHAARYLNRFTQRELAALDLRIGVLLEEVGARELDNPFAIPYVLDALGSTSRAVYPNPRVWRPLMERLLTDLTPNFNGLYIALNRMLADHGVLPEIKATLRARSEHRPADDRDLLATFTQMLHEVSPIPDNVVVPEFTPSVTAPPAFNFDQRPARMASVPTPLQMVPADILAGLAKLAAIGARGDGAVMTSSSETAASHSVNVDPDFPSLDPLMALGTSTALFATLAQWQKLDLPAAIARLAPSVAGVAAAAVPLNLIPHIRTAMAAQINNPSDVISVDVIGLLFDYIFRDPSIPESTRKLFGRLQIPIVKAALLDRMFFSDKRHPARQLLDHLAEAAVGAAHDEAYRALFESTAHEVIDRICADFEIDVSVFREGDTQLLAFIDRERQQSAAALASEVSSALVAEEDEADRAAVRQLLRDRLAGLDVPFEVRAFVETVWADFLSAVRLEEGVDSPPWTAALTTLDDMLWSIVAKERTAQKSRLTRMIPSLIGSLRAGCLATRAAVERSKAFFEVLYQLHIAAIKPAIVTPAAKTDNFPDEAPPPVNVHDYVGEMAIGTWLQFDRAEGSIDARLNWVSPLRAKYIFTSRSRSHAFILTPEDLAYQLGSGTARLVVEPVPLWDRAVSAALDGIAARKPPKGSSVFAPMRAPA